MNPGPSPSSGTGGSSNVLSLASYASFAAMMTARVALGMSMPVTLWFPASAALPASVDAAGWDFSNTYWAGPGPSVVELTTAAGFKCQEGKEPPAISGLLVTHGGTAPFHEQITGSTCSLILDNAWIQRSGAAVFLKLSHAASVLFLTLRNGAYIARQGVGKTVVDVATAGATVASSAFDNSDVQGLTIVSAVGTTWLQTNYSSIAGATINATDQSALDGTLTITNAAGGGHADIFPQPSALFTAPPTSGGTDGNTPVVNPVSTPYPGLWLTGASVGANLCRRRTWALGVNTKVTGRLRQTGAGYVATIGAILLRESGTGKLLVFGFSIVGSAWFIRGMRWNNDTDFNSNIDPLVECDQFMPTWFRLQIVGANIVLSVKHDADSWWTYATIAVSSVFTVAPDQYGICLFPQATDNAGVIIDSLLADT